MEPIIDANDPKFLLGIMRNIEQNIERLDRKSTFNWTLVKKYLLSHTKKAGSTSSNLMCEYMGVNPNGFSFYDDDAEGVVIVKEEKIVNEEKIADELEIEEKEVKTEKIEKIEKVNIVEKKTVVEKPVEEEKNITNIVKPAMQVEIITDEKEIDDFFNS